MPVAASTPTLVRRPVATLVLALAVGTLSSCSGDSDSPSSAAPTSSAAESSSADQPTTPAPSSSAGGGTSDPAAPASLSASLVDFAVELPEQELTAGSYTIDVTNDGDASHDLVIEDAQGSQVAATAVMPPGGSGSLQVDLAPGEYVFYCSVGNHRSMGMELAVTVV